MIITKYLRKASLKQCLVGEKVLVRPQVTILLNDGWTEVENLDLTPEEILAHAAEAAEEQEIKDNLANAFKNWAAVEKDIKAATDIEGVKAILLKYFKVDYQYIKKKKD